MAQPTSNPASASPEESARQYDRFFGPFYFEPYALEVAKRIDKDMQGTVLELAAGTGRVTRHIRHRIAPQARLIASDLDPAMLAVARQQLQGEDISWELLDAASIPYPGEAFDLVVCCFGYMFVPDRAKAFAEAFRVLKPGATFLITTWDTLEHNPASAIARSIAAPFLDGPLPEQFDVPTSMSDEAGLKVLLTETGLVGIHVEKLQLISGSSTAKQAAEGLTQGGIYELVEKTGRVDIQILRENLEKELAQRFGDNPVQVPVSAIISRGQKGASSLGSQRDLPQ
ncbi:MAG: class I SAM-dependent methyltransferase [Chitinophagaceae bacterium]|nr:MAG: class I SAM-dependent methyltransferase [Chitinophagaceae bacterium]